MRRSDELKSVVLAGSLLILFFLPCSSFAFLGTGVNTSLYHSYDGLVCYDCHTIHNSADGAPVIGGGPFPRLLAQPTATDVCLQCHIYPASSAFKAPTVMTITGNPPSAGAMPAGDFYWSMIYPNRGHNPGKSLGVQSSIMPSDPTFQTSPGGNFPTDNWDCTTCHDPHNRFGENVAPWRQLRRKINGIVHTGNETVSFGVESYGGNEGPTTSGYEPIKSNSRGDLQLDANGNSTKYVNKRKDNNALQGANLFAAYGDTNHNVYQGGFSSFCATCHGDFHGGNAETNTVDNGKTRVNSAWVKHPTTIKLGDAAASGYGVAGYTKVVKNSQNTLPNPTGYDWKYPLVKADADFTTTRTTLGAVTDNDRIMCLTCHVAHASPFANMTRWDATGHAFIANGAALTPNGDGKTGIIGGSGTSNGDNIAFGCGKCHQKGGATAFVKSGF